MELNSISVNFNILNWENVDRHTHSCCNKTNVYQKEEKKNYLKKEKCQQPPHHSGRMHSQHSLCALWWPGGVQLPLSQK